VTEDELSKFKSDRVKMSSEIDRLCKILNLSRDQFQSILEVGENDVVDSQRILELVHTHFQTSKINGNLEIDI
jgi:hypothetical protein